MGSPFLGSDDFLCLGWLAVVLVIIVEMSREGIPLVALLKEEGETMRQRFFSGIFVLLCVCSMWFASCGGTTTAQTVQVTLTDYKIESSLTTFTHNSAYHFVITNKGAVQHEFMIVAPMMGMNLSMQEMDKMALAHIPTINPGETRTLDYTFAQTASPGKLEFACHITDHYQRGMHLGIVVQ